MPAKVIKVVQSESRPSSVNGHYEEGYSPRDSYSIALNDPVVNAARGFPRNYITTTKYTLLTFLPKNLFEQFRRISNFYFLVVMVIQLIPGVTPLTPWTSILPLLFVLVVSALKEAIEDLSRYRADKRNNNETFKIIGPNGELTKVFSQNLRTGDIVKIKSGDHFPADFVLLSSSSADGTAYVKTANLDGETNLKLRKCVSATETCGSNVEMLHALRGTIQCEMPNEKLYQFNGRLIMNTNRGRNVISLNHTQFLHRGAQLRNTKFVFGVIVYAGIDTKLFLNQQPPPSKFSTVEKALNKFILALFLFQMFICLLCAILSGVFDAKSAQEMYFLGKNPYNTALFGLRNFFTYFVLFNTMIPISLWVTLELVKVGQAKFMEWDDEMKMEGESADHSYTGMNAKTSNLNEDLGRIEHVFSDKTGTLTENIMKFQRCSIDGTIYETKGYPTLTEALKKNPSNLAFEFLLTMAACHTVVPELSEKTGLINYQSQSPDETALVEIAKEHGYVFTAREGSTVVLEVLGDRVEYVLLATLEFTSARRRMSVILQTPEGNIILLCKGADVVLYDRLADGQSTFKETTAEHLKLFSRDGLRTLVFASKEISRKELDDWLVIFDEANSSIDNREERVEAACEIIENDLKLIGCSAIEDKLQDQVPETIQYILNAGIQIWVLTGDKQETAINIGYSSRLLTPDMDLIIINAGNTDICGEQLRVALEKYCGHYYNVADGIVMVGETAASLPMKPLGLIIDGHTLSFALHDHTEAFLVLGKLCRSVVCCRVTPLQKALVVRVVKQGESKISLAIGDGANDVSMIQEAHVGVGIFGKEGTQAARASDYAIHQFKHLKKLLCAHGRYSYMRVTGIIQYSFYKNMMFTLAMLYFSFYNGFTGQTLYDSWVITFYNIIFTSLPPLIYGLFEKDLREKVIFDHAEAYLTTQRGDYFTAWTFLGWMGSSVWHSIVIYFSCVFLFGPGVVASNGRTGGIWEMGLYASTIAIIVVNLRMALETKLWNVLTHISLWGSILCYVVFLLLYGLIPTQMYHVVYVAMATPSFWMMLLVVPVMCIMPDFTIKVLVNLLRPNVTTILQEISRAPSSNLVTTYNELE